MTRRERLERKLEKRADWAEARDRDARAAFNKANSLTEGIPFGQPILVGHHSEKRHRRVLEKADNAMRKGSESYDMAQHHRSKAAGLADQLDSAIFSDDTDALEALEARLAEREAERATMAAENKYWRKHKTMKGCPGVDDARAERLDREIPLRHSWEQKGPWAPYQLSNLGGRITADKKRLEEVKRRQKAAEVTEAAGGVKLWQRGGYGALQFAEKPPRDILDEIKAAGWRWGAGAWTGPVEKLPEGIVTYCVMLLREARTVHEEEGEVTPDAELRRELLGQAEADRRDTARAIADVTGPDVEGSPVFQAVIGAAESLAEDT